MSTSDSNKTPEFIYGTAWKEDDTEELTRLAVETGFRGIDTANQRKHYNEAGVGRALESLYEDGQVQRDELFIQTKYTYPSGQDHRMPYDPDDPFRDQVRDSLESSLEHLRTDYVDSYVLHGPSTRQGLTDADRAVWETFEELSESDRVRGIGVSNVTAEQLKAFLDLSSEKPAFVQNRCFARRGWDRTIREICESNGLVYQGFSLLTANQRELRSEGIRDIAQRHEKTIPQVIFRFALQVGMVPLTGTTSEEHMQQDLNCFDFELTDEDVQTIETIA